MPLNLNGFFNQVIGLLVNPKNLFLEVVVVIFGASVVGETVTFSVFLIIGLGASWLAGFIVDSSVVGIIVVVWSRSGLAVGRA